MVCQPHQYILMKMASYMPQGYNIQASYTAQQQKGLVYTAPRMGDYVALSGYNSQKKYAGVEQSYLFLKMPEVMGAVGGESFTTRRLNDLVSDDGEKSEFTLPQSDAKNLIRQGYDVLMVYKPQRREKQKKVEENGDRNAKDTEIDTKLLAELIEQELRQFPVANQQVHYV